jgi:hypothetical protein
LCTFKEEGFWNQTIAAKEMVLFKTLTGGNGSDNGPSKRKMVGKAEGTVDLAGKEVD